MMHEPTKPIIAPMTSKLETSLNQRIEEEEEETEEEGGTVYNSVNSSSSSSLTFSFSSSSSSSFLPSSTLYLCNSISPPFAPVSRVSLLSSLPTVFFFCCCCCLFFFETTQTITFCPFSLRNVIAVKHTYAIGELVTNKSECDKLVLTK